jgi:hypothetical protein
MTETDQANPSHEIVATWVSSTLATELKRQAEVDRRSVSSLVRNVLQDTFAETEQKPKGGSS